MISTIFASRCAGNCMHVCVHVYLTSWVSTLLSYRSTQNCPHLDVGQLPSRFSYCTPQLASQHLPVSIQGTHDVVLQGSQLNLNSRSTKLLSFSNVCYGPISQLMQNLLCSQRFELCGLHVLRQLFCHCGTGPGYGLVCMLCNEAL